MGLLKDPDTKSELAPSYLEATQYLPSLANVVWEKSTRIADIPMAEQIELDKSLQLSIRRARIGVEILKRPSDNQTKYDLFQRLNAGGTPANSQELRNCIIIMVNSKYFLFLKEMVKRGAFQTVVSLTEEQIERQRHMEYATRFMVHTFIPYDGKLDVEEYIDKGIIELATVGELKRARAIFEHTFDLLNEAFGSDALRRFEKNKHSGRVSLAAFECIAVGIGRNFAKISKMKKPVEFIQKKIIAFWKQPELETFFAAGMRGTIRIQRTVPFGERWFAK
jgi:hypothetical protein